jgi:hypothetical protein
MDEIPMAFDLPNNTTIDELGVKTISIRTTGHEKTNITVILTCMANRTKLLSLIIFKLKNIPRVTFYQKLLFDNSLQSTIPTCLKFIFGTYCFC